MKHLLAPLFALPLLCTGLALAEEPPLSHDLSGTWRVEGNDNLLGTYQGEITFTPRSGERYDYKRWVRWQGMPSIPESGTAIHTGSRLFLRQDDLPRRNGLLPNLGADTLDVRAPTGRHAVFRPGDDARELLGVFMIPGTIERGRETLSRVSSQASDERELQGYDFPGSGLNSVELLIDGPEAYPAMRRAIDDAQSSVCVQFFSWFDDETGRSMADLLRKKAREGVKVRVLMEAFPQMGGVGWKIGPYMKEAGVEVIIHHTITEGTKNSFKNLGRKLKNGFLRLFGRKKDEQPRESRGILNHDHRKIVVADGKIAFTGGMNIGTKYEEATTWHDTHCSVVGPAVTELEAMFFERWRAAGGKGEPEPAPDWSRHDGTLRVDVVENLPGLRLDITDRYISEVNNARSEVLVQNAYMLYDPVVNALKNKASSGVRTVVILPSNDLNDEALARDAFLWIENDVVRSGVELYKYRDRMTHGKLAIFDRRVTTVGTTNLDRMAMELNAEVNLFIPDGGFANYANERVFVQDIPNSDRIWVGKLSWWERVKATVMHMMRGVL